MSGLTSIPKYDTYVVTGANPKKTGSKEISGLVCKDAKDGSFVNKLKFKSGLYVDSVGIVCSNDSTVYESQGGEGGSIVEVSVPSGIQKLVGKTGLYLDSVGVYSITNNLIKKVGADGGNLEYSLDCG